MDKGGGLEGVIVALARQPVSGKPSQFVIDQWQQFCAGWGIAGGRGLKKLPNVGHVSSRLRKADD